MATIGLRDLYRAPITIGTDGAEDYGTPVRMAKAISAEISVEVAEAILYADELAVVRCPLVGWRLPDLGWIIRLPALSMITRITIRVKMMMD